MSTERKKSRSFRGRKRHSAELSSPIGWAGSVEEKKLIIFPRRRKEEWVAVWEMGHFPSLASII